MHNAFYPSGGWAFFEFRIGCAAAEFGSESVKILQIHTRESGSAQSLFAVEAVPQDALHQQVIGRRRHAYADSGIELPLLAEIDIYRRKDQVLLVAHRVETRDRTQ